MRYLSIILAIILTVGCGTQKHLPIETAIKDTTIVHYRDSVVTKYDTVRVDLPKESHSSVSAATDSSHLETSLASSNAWIDDEGRLHHDIENKKGAITATVPVQEHFHSEETETAHSENTTATKYVEVPAKLTAFQEIKIKCFFPILFLLLAACWKPIWKILKKVIALLV